MGGGDLNLKKSWHPHTLKNQKRVWEAEQADAVEKRKLLELQHEIQSERNFEELKKIGQSSGVLAADDSKRLEWMYKGAEHTLNREEYLTGRSIDKQFEKQDAVERQKEQSSLVGITVPKNHVEHECIPFSIRAFRGVPTSDDQVDLQRKIMEDPLMAIKQREMETRKKLLENPVKLKEIHRLLQTDKMLKAGSTSALSSHKRHKEKKSSKKKKKRSQSRERGSDDDGSGNDLDSLLAKKYKKVLGEKGDRTDAVFSLDKLLNEKYQKLTTELDKMKHSNKKHKKSKSKKKKRDSASYSEHGDNDAKKKHVHKIQSDRSSDRFGNSRDDNRLRRHSKERKHSTDRRRSRARSRTPLRNRFRDDKDRRNNRRSESRSNVKEREREKERGHKKRSRSPLELIQFKDHPKKRDKSRSRSRSRNIEQKRNKNNKQTDANRKDNSSRKNRDDNINRIRSRSRSKSRDKNEKNRRVRRRSRSTSNYRDAGTRKHSRSRSASTTKKTKDLKITYRERQSSKSKNTSDEISIIKKKPSVALPRRQSEENLSPKEPPKPIRTVAMPPPPRRSSRRSSSSDGSSKSKSKNDDRATTPTEPPKNYGLVTAGGDKIELKSKYEPRKSPEKTNDAKQSTLTFVPPPSVKKKLTEEEKAVRLREMLANVEWHDRERTKNKLQNEEKAKREKEQETMVEFDRNYIHKELHKALNMQDSVEARIKSNVNNIQRTSSSMHSHFAKK